jgi:hypothetical protein
MIIKLLSGITTGNLLLILILAGSATDAPAQVIRGLVVDSQTGDAVGFASVYFSGTTVGTVAGENGEFELDISSHPRLPLTVSAVGYTSITLEKYSPDKPLKIYLSPRVYDIPTLEISGASLERERRDNLGIFRDQFLGRGIYSKGCEILNEEDITFNYGSDSATLRAIALKPLKVHNKALGYIIIFHLENFEFCRETGNALYTGKFIFTDHTSRISRGVMERRRNNAYPGSAMHFFRSLWANELKAEGYRVQDDLGNNLGYEDIVRTGEGQKYLEYIGDLFIYYTGSGPGGNFRLVRSPVRLLKSRVFFDESGYFDPVAIMLTGEMGKHRVSDMLPLDFVPGK